MLHLNKLVSRAVITVAATSVMAFGMGQAAQAAPNTLPKTAISSQEAAAPSSEFAYKGEFYRVTATQDGGVAVSKHAADEPAAAPSDAQASFYVKMSHERTTALYWSAITGATGTVIAICQYYAPSSIDAGCAVIGTTLATYVAQMSAPGANDCFGFGVRTVWDLPPWDFSIGYVPCR